MRLRKYLLLILFILFTLFADCINAGEVDKRKAVISFLKGGVKVTTVSKEIKKASLAMALYEGDRIDTSENSRVEIKLDEGSTIRISANTSIVLSGLKEYETKRETTVNISSGRIWLNVTKLLGKDSKFKIETPVVVAAVKGTVYRADVEKDGKTNVNVYDGEVSVQKIGSAEEISLNKLETIVVLPDKILEKTVFDEKEDEKDEWIRWNKSRDKLRVMVIIPERIGKNKSIVSVAENAAIERILNNYLFKVIDKEQTDKIREQEKIKQALKGDNKAAASAGLELAADLVILGEASAQFFTQEFLQGMTSSVANITGRVIRVDTAEVLAAKREEGRALDITAEGAANKALALSSKKISDYFVAEIVKKWKKEFKKGASFDLVVYGVTYDNINKISNVLLTIQGVKDVEKLYFVANKSLLNIIFVGDTVTLAEKIRETDFKDVKIEVVGLSAYRVELEVKK